MRNVIVMGKGELAVKICRYFRNSPDWWLTKVVPVIPEPPWTESLRCWCIENRIDFIGSGNYQDIPDSQIDLVFSVYYDKIIKQDFIDKCGRILNLHNAPLPRYRGVRPINWALKNKEKEHGVTIHAIEAGIDSGPIYGQWKFDINPEIDEVKDVYKRCIFFGWELFLDVIHRLDEITPKPQDNSKATYYSAKQNDQLWERVGWTREESMPECFRQQERLMSDFADRLVSG